MAKWAKSRMTNIELHRVTTSAQWGTMVYGWSVVEPRKMLSIKDPLPLVANEVAFH